MKSLTTRSPRPRSWNLLLVTMLSVLAFPPAHGLEGGSHREKVNWGKVPKPKQPDARTRQRELAARKSAMEADKAAIRKRLQTQVPDDAKMAELDKKLREITRQYGWVPEQEFFYGIRSMAPMLNRQEVMPSGLLDAFVQLKKDLEARGVDLILLPLVPNPHFMAHELVPGIEAHHEYNPGWAKMVLQMLEADLEVVDTTMEFRKEAGNPLLVSWANDFHTGSLGRQIAARALAERLQRYDFARELAPNRPKWKQKELSRTGASWPQRIAVVNKGLQSTKWWKKANKVDVIPPDVPQFHGGRKTLVPVNGFPREAISAMRKRRFNILEVTLPKAERDGLRRTEIVLFGDSQLHSAVFGTGFPEILMSEVGGVFRWGSKSWSGFSPPEIYLDIVPDSGTQPRVAVLTFLPKYFWLDYRNGNVRDPVGKYKPKAMPAFSGKSAVPGGSVSAVSAPVEVDILITDVSTKPTQDAESLDYDEALLHVAAQVTKGPLKGKTIGLRYWILYQGEWTKADLRIRKGQTFSLKLVPWGQVIKKDRNLGQHQVFDTVEQELTVPIYWAVEGALSPAFLLK